MQHASPRLDKWPGVVSQISSLIDLEASARRHRALIRERAVRSASDLLHLALLYGPGELSLRGTAGFAILRAKRGAAAHWRTAGIAELCDVSLLDRPRNSGDYLADVLNHLLAHRRGGTPVERRSRLTA
jgi:hypothetical protein